MKERTEPDYLTIEQVADKLGLSKKTIRNWINYKICPFTFNKIGGALRIRRTALEAYLKRTEVNQKSITN